MNTRQDSTAPGLISRLISISLIITYLSAVGVEPCFAREQPRDIPVAAVVVNTANSFRTYGDFIALLRRLDPHDDLRPILGALSSARIALGDEMPALRSVGESIFVKDSERPSFSVDRNRGTLRYLSQELRYDFTKGPSANFLELNRALSASKKTSFFSLPFFAPAYADLGGDLMQSVNRFSISTLKAVITTVIVVPMLVGVAALAPVIGTGAAATIVLIGVVGLMSYLLLSSSDAYSAELPLKDVHVLCGQSTRDGVNISALMPAGRSENAQPVEISIEYVPGTDQLKSIEITRDGKTLKRFLLGGAHASVTVDEVQEGGMVRPPRPEEQGIGQHILLIADSLRKATADPKTCSQLNVASLSPTGSSTGDGSAPPADTGPPLFPSVL